MNTAFERIRSALEGSGAQIRHSADKKFTAQCPAHDDGSPSLSVSGIEGQALIHCFGGCATEDVLASLNMAKRDLFDNPRGATYRYDDGRIVNRSPDKRFSQSGNTKGRPQLYHLSKLQGAPDCVAFLVEGEKDVHAIESAGGVATCNPMGSSTFGGVDIEPLRGRSVTVIVDKDEAGARWATAVRDRLSRIAADIQFVQASSGKDAADHIAAAKAGEELDGWEPYEPFTKVQTFGAVKLADLLIPRLQGRFRWCKELGWLHFDGAKWAPDADPAVLAELVATIKDYTRVLLDSGASGLTREHCVELGGFSGGSQQNQALKIARTAPGVLTSVTAFDALPIDGAPWLLPCANGYTVELHPDATQTVRQTRPIDLNTKAACAYDPDAAAPKIAAAFKDYQPDEDVRRFMLQQWARGLSGMGMEKFVVNLGESGGNGKSTMQGLLTAAAGDYAAELPVEVILKGNNSAREVYRSELAAMRGARLVFCDEPEEGSRYDLGMLKKVTGGGTLQGRAMGKDAVTYEPKVLFQMASNNRPSWSADGGMERRYVEISWDFEIGKDAVQESFKEELKAETSGFLNAILKHWSGAGPLVTPDRIRRQTDAGMRGASPAAQFVTDALERTQDETVSAGLMFDAFKKWWDDERQRGKPVTQTKLGRELERLGFKKEKKGTVRYLDVTVREKYLPRGT
jgi:P4 family phage/plasmid primase-like protien